MNKNDLFQQLLNNKEKLERQASLLSNPSQEAEPVWIVEEEKTENSYKKGLDYAIRILSLRDYSEYKMREKLKQRQIPSSDIDQVITKLLDLNYLREEEYTRQRIKQLLVKGYANSYILQKLQKEHLRASNEDIERMRTENELGSESQIDYLISKKLRGKEIPTEYEAKIKLKNKITRFLISKGFHFSEINSALAKHI